MYDDSKSYNIMSMQSDEGRLSGGQMSGHRRRPTTQLRHSDSTDVKYVLQKS